MKHSFFRRLLATLMALCLCVLPTLSLADTYLPDGPVTHVDFSLGLKLHADAFPTSKAHLSEWETFLNKLDLRGSMDTLAMLTPDSRVYLNGALRLNGKDQLPFVYDGYHSYRYITSPALGDEVMFFQMHNFLEFMLKPYYYMELPTQYMALLMYPEAAYAIGDEYYTPIAEMIENAKQAAMNGEPVTAQSESEQGDAALLEEDSEADNGDGVEAVTAADAAAPVVTDATAPTASETPTVTATAEPTTTPEPTPTAVPVVAADGTITFNVPYEALYEQCENLDLIVNDDLDLERAYFFFTCLLTDIYASDMTLTTLGALEDVLDTLDPDQNGMTVVQTATGMTCTIGDTQVFSKQTDGDATAIAFTVPTPDGYNVTFNYAWQPQAVGANLTASISILDEGAQAILVTAEGTGLPREGDLGGKGQLTFKISGNAFDHEVPPLMLGFDWARDSATLPYTLGLTVDWIHPETLKPAITLNFNGTFKAEDKSVFVEGSYPQNDFFNLNETFLEGYKERLLPTIALKLAPILLETPAGVINDLYTFANQTDILVSFLE